jgi:hypothetical protein
VYAGIRTLEPQHLLHVMRSTPLSPLILRQSHLETGGQGERAFAEVGEGCGGGVGEGAGVVSKSLRMQADTSDAHHTARSSTVLFYNVSIDKQIRQAKASYLFECACMRVCV